MIHVVPWQCLFIFCRLPFLKYYLCVVRKSMIRVVPNPSKVFLASLTYKNYTCLVRENDYSGCRLDLKSHFVKFVDWKENFNLVAKSFLGVRLTIQYHFLPPACRLPQYSLSRSQISFIYMIQGGRKMLCTVGGPPESLISRPRPSRIVGSLDGRKWINRAKRTRETSFATSLNPSFSRSRSRKKTINRYDGTFNIAFCTSTKSHFCWLER
jgi:hypothetical protein